MCVPAKTYRNFQKILIPTFFLEDNVIFQLFSFFETTPFYRHICVSYLDTHPSVSSQYCVLLIVTMKQTNDRRKPFQGKHRHKDLREFKNQEIKRSLVHRARLRKNYFKLLEKEGGSDKLALAHQEQDYEDKNGSDDNVNPDDLDEMNDDGEEGENTEPLKASQSQIRRSGPLPDQSTAGKMAKREERRKPMNFAERARLARERKEQNRQEQLDKVREKREMILESKRIREQKKNSLTQRTKRGQPVMGPRINDLLEKIRKNN